MAASCASQGWSLKIAATPAASRVAATFASPSSEAAPRAWAPGLPSAYHSYTPPASRLPAAGTQPHAMSPPDFGQSLSIGVVTLGSAAEAGATHGAPASSDVHPLPGGSDVLGHGSSRKGASLMWPTASSASTHTEDGGCSSATGPSAAAVLPVHFPCPSPPLRPSGPCGPGRPGSEHGESSAGPSDTASAGVDGERGVPCEGGPTSSHS